MLLHLSTLYGFQLCAGVMMQALALCDPVPETGELTRVDLA